MQRECAEGVRGGSRPRQPPPALYTHPYHEGRPTRPASSPRMQSAPATRTPGQNPLARLPSISWRWAKGAAAASSAAAGASATRPACARRRRGWKPDRPDTTREPGACRRSIRGRRPPAASSQAPSDAPPARARGASRCPSSGMRPMRQAPVSRTSYLLLVTLAGVGLQFAAHSSPVSVAHVQGRRWCLGLPRAHTTAIRAWPTKRRKKREGRVCGPQARFC